MVRDSIGFSKTREGVLIGDDSIFRKDSLAASGCFDTSAEKERTIAGESTSPRHCMRAQSTPAGLLRPNSIASALEALTVVLYFSC